MFPSVLSAMPCVSVHILSKTFFLLLNLQCFTGLIYNINGLFGLYQSVKDFGIQNPNYFSS